MASSAKSASDSATSTFTFSGYQAPGPSVTDTGGLSSIDPVGIVKNVSKYNSALASEFASSAAQVKAQKDLIDYSNKFTAEQNELNRIFQQNSADKAMEWSSEEAQKTRDWQEEMSNTAYVRAVADLQAAGLNPILAYTNGSASTPAGTTGSAYQASGSAGSSASGTASKANASGGWSSDMDVEMFNKSMLFELKRLGINSATSAFDALINSIGKALGSGNTYNFNTKGK